MGKLLIHCLALALFLAAISIVVDDVCVLKNHPSHSLLKLLWTVVKLALMVYFIVGAVVIQWLWAPW